MTSTALSAMRKYRTLSYLDQIFRKSFEDKSERAESGTYVWVPVGVLSWMAPVDTSMMTAAALLNAKISTQGQCW